MPDRPHSPVKLTQNDREILAVLHAAGTPITAYAIIGRIDREKVFPPTVYRSLNRLLEAGLVHRIESKKAYFACPSDRSCAGESIFMVCSDCGQVAEISNHAIERQLTAAARDAAFEPAGFTLEAHGLCANCKNGQTRAAG